MIPGLTVGITRRLVWSLLAALALGCGGPNDTAASDAELLVSAAASLTDVFEELGATFAAEQQAREPVFNLAGSQALTAQLLEGAPSDVFASADPEQMDLLVAEGLAGQPVLFATNVLEIVVEPGNPLGIDGLADLARDELVVVLAGEQVPAGRYAAEVLEAADVEVAPASLELDVRAVLTKVAAGEADVGIVYRSDVVASDGTVEGVPIPAEDNVVAEYHIAVLDAAEHPRAAAAFVDLVRGPEGERALSAAGFIAA